ncbi:MAG: aspartate/glutamate racemase family protein [Pseudotabrizicola sp.]|nr:aspartate/glutamate racemase family protein [Pseudotabrizicola sp.]
MIVLVVVLLLNVTISMTAAIQTLADRRIAEPLALDLLAANADHDAYVMACFEDIALVQARRFLQVPVVGAVHAVATGGVRVRRRQPAVGQGRGARARISSTHLSSSFPAIRALARPRE